MDDFEKSFTQIKQLSTAVTEANYYDYCKQGYDILVRIHDSAVPKSEYITHFLNITPVYRKGYPKIGLQICWIIYAGGVIRKNTFGRNIRCLAYFETSIL